MRLPTAACAVALLALPAGASALDADPQRFTLNWSERAVSRGQVVMTFRVREVLFQFGAWAADVSFTNRSRRAIRIRPQFALLLSKTKASGADYQALLVRRARPALPKTLRPGQRWTGVLGGPGRPRAGVWVRFNFGYFEARGLFPGTRGFAWITDHAFEVGETA